MRTAMTLGFVLLATQLPAAEPENPFPKATPESQGLAAKDLDIIADVVRGFVKEEKIVGAEMLIIKNNHTVYHQAFGLKDKDKKAEMPTNTIFCVRSMTKPVIGAAIQLLVDDGKIALDDPIAKHLPSFDNDKSRAITVRQLLTHNGGLKLSTLLETGLKGVSSVRELADRIGKNGPEFKPGERFNYSDDGADTLTALVAAVSKMPAEQFVQERLLDPLGMKDTVCLVKKDDPRIERFGTAYGGGTGAWNKFWSPGSEPLFPYFLGSQGMYSTPADYARFLRMIADDGKWNGKQILSREAAARIRTPAQDRSGIPTGFDDRRCAYGQMMMLYLDPAGKVRAFGHGGSDGTHAYAIPEKDLFVLYFTQSRGNLTSIDLEPALHRLLIDPGKRAFVADKTVDPKTVAPLVGLYWFDAVKCPVEVLVRDGRLRVELPWQAEVELKSSDDPNKWVAALNPTLSIEFQRDKEKPASGLIIHQPKSTQELPRLKKDDGLPTVDELMKLREKTQGTAKLAGLGVMRIKGSLEQLPAKNKGTVEIWTDGMSRYRAKTTLSDNSVTVVNGEKVTVKRGALAPQPLQGAEAEQVRLDHPAFAAADWRTLFDEIQVLKRFETEKKNLILLRCVSKAASARILVVESETGRLVGDRHIEVVPGIGRIGSRVQFLEYKDVDGVQLPVRMAQTYPTPLLGRFESVFESFETKVKAPEGTFELK